MTQCVPFTYPLIEDGIIFDGSEDMSRVNALIFHVEMDNNKKPPEFTLGGRIRKYDGKAELPENINITGIFTNEGEVEFLRGSQINGHINRNIRLLTAVMQATEPQIELLGFA